MWALLDDDPVEFQEGNLSWYDSRTHETRGKGTGDDRLLTVTGATYQEALRKFQDLAVEWRFGDGQPMVPPTKDLVDKMLEGTDRHRDDMFGGLKMGGGLLSVETVAINAVMAGCKPEHMPVLVGIAQALAMGWDEDGTQWHIMTTGASGSALLAVVSGPIAKAIGMENEMGFSGAGNGVNNALARAFRLFYLNIAFNDVMSVDTQGYGNRPNDYLMMVVPENYDVVRELGWETHGEYMGMGADSSTVTITQATTTNYLTAANNDTNWSAVNLSTLNKPTHAVGSPNAANDSMQVTFVSPAHAYAMKHGLGASTANATKSAWAVGTFLARTTGTRADEDINIRRGSLFVVGPDNGSTFSFNSGGSLYKGGVHNTVLLSGSKASPGRTSPGAPANVNVVINEAERSAVMTWDPPVFTGGGTIERYEVFMYHGGVMIQLDPQLACGHSHHVYECVAACANVREYTFENLAPGEQYHFRVRAISNVVNAVYFTNRAINTHWGGSGAAGTGQLWLDLLRMRGLGAWGRAINPVRSAEVGFSVYSHALPGRARVPEVTQALQELINHANKPTTTYIVRLPQNVPFSDHGNTRTLVPSDTEFYALPILRHRPGGDEAPFRIIVPKIDNGEVLVRSNPLPRGTLIRSLVSMHAGSNMVLVVNPDAGYVLVDDTLVVNDTEGNPLAGTPVIVGGTATAPTYTFEMPAEDIIITAKFRFPITSLNIGTAQGAPAPALVTVARNRTVQFSLILNDNATPDYVVWSTSNAGLATVDADGLVTIKNMVGTVTLTATDPHSGIANSIILRIS